MNRRSQRLAAAARIFRLILSLRVGTVLLAALFVFGGSASAETVCTISGTEGRDVLVGSPGPDVICGFGGDDLISGLGGADTLA